MWVEENCIARTSAVAFGRGRVYRIGLQFHPPAAYPPELGLRFEEIADAFSRGFVAKLHVGGGRLTLASCPSFLLLETSPSATVLLLCTRLCSAPGGGCLQGGVGVTVRAVPVGQWACSGDGQGRVMSAPRPLPPGPLESCRAPCRAH